MHPAEQPYVAELSDEAKKLRLRLRTAIVNTIERCEAIALSAEKAEVLKTQGLTKVRVEAVLAWFDELAEGRASIPVEMGEKEVSELASELKDLLTALLVIREGKSLSGWVRRYEYDLAPHEFIIDPRDVPTWEEIPSETEMMTEFGFEFVTNDYRKGRKLKGLPNVSPTTYQELMDREGFDITAMDLFRWDYFRHDLAKRQALLRSISVESSREFLPPAQLFDITEIINRKSQKLAKSGPWVHCLTTKEVLEAFDEAGVRPATFQELLAYSKHHWKPEGGTYAPYTEAEMAQRASLLCIIALGSVFSKHGDDRCVPSINFDHGKRELSSHSNDFWFPSHLFLVFRKQ